MRIRLVYCALAALALTACSSSSTPESQPASAGSVAQQVPAVPADATLGSPAWYAWVSHALRIDTNAGPKPGTRAWQQAVQAKLGPEAPQSKPGTPAWQQAVDSLLRTRLPATATSTH
ncbi:MAG TPA: hypothetical protein VFJ15_00680 [Oleiagrimonas sp.]|nr:hypothetical protein [Oleiagrimonas sp.]